MWFLVLNEMRWAKFGSVHSVESTDREEWLLIIDPPYKLAFSNILSMVWPTNCETSLLTLHCFVVDEATVGKDREEPCERVSCDLDRMFLFLCNALMLAEIVKLLSVLLNLLLLWLLLLLVEVVSGPFDGKLKCCAFSHYRFLYLCALTCSVCFCLVVDLFL